MTTADYLVLLFYLAGTLAVGVALSAWNKNSDEMFAAGGRSPWWAAGLSGYMTMFSAGTFVVWGGIAYEFGLVAVAINLCYGIAALLVGFAVAGRWKDSGVQTPAQFIELRYGAATLHFYTWSMMVFKVLTTSVGLYALAVMLVDQMPLSPGNPLVDSASGKLSLTWAIVGFGAVIVAYTVIGGLWGVLMNDVVQFIVLSLAVLFVVPLMFLRSDGLGSLVAGAPEGFFSLTSGEYTWLFLMGWTAIHYFVIGAEWAFVQRFICVPTAKDARKGAYLFGALYLFSPIVWFLPPMILGILEPMPAGLDVAAQKLFAERAYIRACESVLPSGMMGLMLAAMFAATASGASGQLNVFAGVLTHDIYRPLARRALAERDLVRAGRVFTCLLGAVLVILALAVPVMGGARDLIISASSLVAGPLLAPTIWGLFSRSVTSRAVWWTAGSCFAAGVAVKFGVSADEAATGWPPVDSIVSWVRLHPTTVDIVIGAVFPVAVLLIVQATSRGVSTGWQRVADLPRPEFVSAAAAGRAPAALVALSLLLSGGVMAWLAIINDASRGVLAGFALALMLLGLAILSTAIRRRQSAAVSEASYAEA